MATLDALLQRLPEVHVGVVGDVIADLYVFANPSRVSREAPVLVMEYEREETIPGGAANTASNLAALGVRTDLIGSLGADPAGEGVLRELARRQVGLEHVQSVAGAATITKTRILVGEAHRTKQQMFRVDRNPAAVPAPSQEARLLEALRHLDETVQGWVVSDYDYGLFTEGMVQWLREAARRKPVVVDSRHGWKRFHGVTVLTPNEGEAQEATGLTAETNEDAEAMGRAMQEQAGVESLLLTRGNLGMMLFQRGQPVTSIPIAGKGEVVDVSGAGDTVVAAFVGALLAGATAVQAAWIANCAASVVVMKLGAATCSPAELARVLAEVAEPEALNRRKH